MIQPEGGYIENEHIYIIKTELSNAMKAEGYSPEKILRSWADQGRIPWTSQGGKCVMGVRGKRVNGVQPWLVRITAES